MKVYRIVEIKNGQPYSLFHGTRGSRLLPIGEWITAEFMPARDGGGQPKDKYLSGFHVLLSLEDALRYLKRFRQPRNLIVIACDADGIRQKGTSKGIWLANQIKITDLTPWGGRMPRNESKGNAGYL